MTQIMETSPFFSYSLVPRTHGVFSNYPSSKDSCSPAAWLSG